MLTGECGGGRKCCCCSWPFAVHFEDPVEVEVALFPEMAAVEGDAS